MDHSDISAIIPAAGKSSRMGRHKPLMPLGDSSVIQRVVNLFQTVGIEDIRVVTGFQAADIDCLLQPSGIKTVHNHAWPDGMFSSITTGLKSLASDREAFFILPVDIPLVRPQTLTALLQAYHPGRPAIIYPVFQGKRGHPPLISADFIQEILLWHGQGGLRAFLDQKEMYAKEIPAGDEAVLFDLDRPEDYDRMVERYSRFGIPSTRECTALMEDVFKVDPGIRAHCRLVAFTALCLGKALNQSGGNIDLDLLMASGLLHDLARKDHDHAGVGAEILRRWGYPAVAEIVADHMDIRIGPEPSICEKEIIYLADKLIDDNKLISIEERLQAKMNEFPGRPEALQAIQARFDKANIIKQRWEAASGCALSEIINEVSTEKADSFFSDRE